jgi:FkbM family methyltransferase
VSAQSGNPPSVTSVRVANEQTPFHTSAFNYHVNYAAYFVGTGFGHVDPTPSARIVTSLPHPPPLKSSWISDTALHIRFGPIPRLNSDVLISVRDDDPPLRVGGVSLVGAEAGEELLEWRALIAARDEAVGRGAAEFTFVELGAGFGRWSAAAAHLAAEGGLRARLVLVEAEPLHFEWIDTFMKGEGVSEELYTRVNAAVGARSGGSTFFFVKDHNYDAATWFGQSATDFDFVPSEEVYQGMPLYVNPWDRSIAAVRIANTQLEDVLPEGGVVDLVDMDVQGAEGEIVAAAVTTLSARVLRMFVSTHSHELEDFIKETVFKQGGWELLYDERMGAVGVADEAGPLAVGDGVQSWRNARLTAALQQHA